VSVLDERISRLSPEKRRLLEARLSREGLGRAGSRSVPPREPGDAGPFPLTWGMRRLWFVDRLDPGSTAYNIPFAGRLAGVVDPAALAAALREVVRRHEVLRTRFLAVDGEPVQMIDPPPPRFQVPLVDLAGLDEPVREAEALRLTDAAPQVPFDLGGAPMMRVVLVRLGPGGGGEPRHDLLVTMPHIVTDAWSMAVLFRELPPIYDALRRGRPSPLPEPPIQVADFALWQRRFLDEDRVRREMDHWRERLGGAPVVLELPTDRPRPPVQTDRGRRWYLDLGPAEARAVRALADREGVTVFMVLLAVFNLVLLRWSGQRDQLVGTPIATRTQPESHDLIGFFIDNAVLRSDLSGDPPFRELLGRVKDASLTTFGHGDLPFDKVVEALGVARDLSRPPLIQHLFVYQNVHIPEPEFEGIELLASQQTDARAARFELTLGWFDWKGGLRGGFEYPIALFDRSTMARMASHYRNLLLDALAHPERPLSALRALGAGERHQVLAEGRGAAAVTAAATVDGLVRAAAARRPAAVAAADGAGGALTYGGLVAAGDRLAARLATLGVAPEEPVAVVGGRSPRRVAAVYGVLAAGAVCLPLDPDLPEERLALLLRDAGATVVVLTDGPGAAPPVVPPEVRTVEMAVAGDVVEDAGPGAEGGGVARPGRGEAGAALGSGPTKAAQRRTRSPADPRRAAFLVYTSGSTGRPKGVVVPHGALANLALAAAREYGLRPDDRVAQVLAVGFDASLLETLPALAAGARLETVDRETVLGGPALVEALARRRVSVLVAVPSLLAGLPAAAPEALPALRLLVSGGEALPPALAARWGHCRLVNSYGPTEAAVVACQWHRPVGAAAAPRSLPIGGALAGAEAVVVDGEGHPAPIGVPGELRLGGAGLARGYHRRPAATARAFVPHPFAGPGRGGERLYRTGDLARRLGDGSLVYLGRLDDQVKVRGQRLELGEVEAALAARPEVAEAAAALRRDPGGRERLVAWVVPAPGAAAEPRELRAALARRLTEAMIPSAWGVVGRLPRLASGKLDRAALPEPEWRQGGGGEPRGATETALAAVWRELLGVARVGPDDDFFALGGDSIASIQMISRAAEAGIRLTPQQVFGNPTLAALARAADEAVGQAGAAEAAGPEPEPESGPLPLLPAQRWFLALGLAQPQHWNMSLWLRLREPRPAALLAAALAALARRHEALRLRLVPAAVPVALEAAPPKGALRLPVVDVSRLDGAAARAARRRAAAAHQGTLDLSAGPLGVVLFRCPKGDRLLLTVHHLAVDAVSWRVLLDDLEAAAAALAAGRPPRLPPSPTSLAAWSRFAAEWAATPEAAEQRTARRAESAAWSAAGILLPVSGAEAGIGEGREAEGAAATVALVLDATETAAFGAAARRLGARPEEALLAALVEAVAPWSGERALAVDIERHGRDLPFPGIDLTRTVGWLTAFEPLLLDLRRTPAGDPAAAVAAVRDAARPALERLPWSLLRWTAPEAEAWDVPPRPVSFNYLGRVDGPAGDGRLLQPETEPPAPLRAPANRRPHPLEVNAWIADGRLHGELRCPRGAAAAVGEVVERWAAGLRSVAALAVDDPALRRAQGSSEEAGPPRQERAGSNGVRDLPLSAAQQRLWFLDRLEPGNPAYNVSAAVRLEGRLELGALAAALAGVERRHEALRTTFPMRAPETTAVAGAVASSVPEPVAAGQSPEAGETAVHGALPPARPPDAAGEGGSPARGPVQRVHPPAPVALPRADLSALPAARREAEERRLLARRALQSFDLAAGPLLRVLLVDLGPAGDVGAPSRGERRAAGPPASRRWGLHLGLHHVIADGWSVSLVVREVAALYAAFAGGRRAGLPPAPGQYGDAARRERRRLEAGGELERQLAWWRDRLAGLPPALELPTDRPRPVRRGNRGGETGLTLSPGLSGHLRDFARAAAASPFMVLLAALQVLLARWTGQRDFAVGAPVAGRGDAAAQGTVGLFLNHLVLRSDLPEQGGTGFRDLVARVRESALAAFAHAEVPFERVVEAVAPRRDLSRTPLFQVFLNMLNFPAVEASLPGLHLAELPPAALPASFEWTLYVKERGPALHLELLYDAELFDRGTAGEALAQLETLLEAALEEPATPVDALPLLTRAARRALPDPRQAQDDGWPGPPHAAVERWAADRPRRPAVVSRAEPGGGEGGGGEGGGGEAAFGYGELAAAARRLAGALAAAGVRRGDRVAVLARREAALVAAMLGVHRAGAAFLLLDPAHPAARNAALVRRAAPRAVLVLGGDRPPAEIASAAGGLPLLMLPPLGAWAEDPLLAAGATPHEPDLTADDAAVLTFTSGSTGEPKGVLGRHRSLTHFLPWQTERFGLGPDDRFSLLSGLAHDPLQRETFTALWSGGTLAIPEPGARHRPGRLAAWLAEAEVTVAHLTPALARLLGERPAGAPAPRLPRLRRAFFVGDVLTRGTVERLAALAPDLEVVNLYGATETQRAVSFFPLADLFSDRPCHQVVPLGRGMPDVQLLVLRRDGGRCGAGEVGEVFVRSPHLALGYLGAPRTTAERFLPDGFGGSRGGRLYRTGDLGRHRRDGGVEPLGRADRQVKVRGFRVEPAEVEAALEDHPAVAQAAVLPRGDGDDRRLVAWWVPADGFGEAAEADLRAHLAARLPEPMVPAAWVRLDALPLTANRKLDRDALPEPPRPAAGTPAEPPATATEAALAEIWSEVLGTGAPGRGDDFFALGGHSLRLVQVLARVAERFGVELPVREAFAAPTLTGMAAALDAARRSAGPAPQPLDPVPRQGPLPVSLQQQRLLFLHRMEPAGAAYNLPAALDLEGRLEVPALRRALAALVARHEALRTRFAEVDGDPVQVVVPSADRPFPLPRVDLGGLPPATRRREAARLSAAAAAAPFDLARGPLLRGLLLHAPAGDATHRLVLAVHHAVADGWSLGLLLREAARLYAEAAGGPPAALPPLRLQYADFAAWQRRTLAGDELEARLEAWRRRLAGVEPAVLPVDRPRRPVRRGRGGRVPLALTPARRQALAALAAGASATPFQVLLAAFRALLARYGAPPRFAVGTAVANRRHPDLEPVVGFFANTLALPLEAAEEPSFRAAVETARRRDAEALADADLPFERLVAALGPFRDHSRPPLVQVFLALDAAPLPPLGALPDLRIAPAALDAGTSRFELAVSFAATGEGLAGVVEYDSDLFDRTTALRIAGHLDTLLAAALADPSRPPSALPLLGDGERQQLLVEASGAGVAAPGPVGDGDPRSWLVEEAAAAVLRPPSSGDETGRPAKRDGMAAPAPEAESGAEAAAPRIVSSADERRGGGLHTAVFARAAAVPDAAALVEDGVSRTYGEVAGRALALARHLRRAGIARPGTETRIGVLLPRGADQATAVLGVLAAGAAWVPLDPSWPAERLAFVAADAGLAALLVPGAASAPPPHLPSLPVVVVEQAWRTVSESDRSFPATPAVRDETLAYVFYTSGSSGRPKGVMVSHGAAARRVADAVERFGLAPGGTFLQVVSPSFDPWLVEVFATLSSGARLVFASSAALRDGAVLAEELAESRATAMTTVPSLLAETPADGLEHLAVVGTGGEPCPPEVARRWAAGRRLLNLYGPTETTVYATAGEGPGEGEAGPPLGVPAAGTRVHVVPPRPGAAEPLPAGVPGELAIAGAGLARGYLARPSATAAAFVPDPWGPPGSRLYRSGDRAVRDAGGRLRLLGRLDRQVKVRGHRVEPGEVEAALAAHPGVGEAVVVPRTAPGGVAVDRLVAYVTAAGGGGVPAAEELRGHLGRRLPESMVPALFVPLAALPRTASGKVDRAALPDPRPAAAPGAAAARPPRAGVEEELAALWAEVLDVEEVAADDDFFALGGHSLAAMRLASRLRDAFGVELPLAELFEEPVLAAAARRLETALAAAAGAGAMAPPPLVPEPRAARAAAGGAERLAPASFAQERLWFLARLEPRSSAYNVPAGAWLRGDLDVAILEAALAAVVRRHEALRTVFAERRGRPLQRVLPPPPPAGLLDRFDLAGLPAGRRRPEALRLARRLARLPFDLARGPLLRPALASLGDGEHLLSLTLHHAVCDEGSVGVFLRELEAFYATLRDGRRPRLAALAVQYADYAAWQRGWLDEAALAPRLDAWRRALEGVPPRLELPADLPPREDGRIDAGGRVPLVPAAGDWEGVRRLARRLRATPFQVVLAALFAQLGRYGNDDAVIGTPVANRGPRATEGLIGFFVNTLPLRVRTSGDPAFAALVERVRGASLAAFALAETPFERVVAAAAPRDPAAAPLVQVMLAYHDPEPPRLDLPGVVAAPLALDNGGAKLDLVFQVGERDGGLGGVLEYRASRFGAAAAARVAGHFAALLAAAVERPETPLSALPLLSATERRHLLGVLRGGRAAAAGGPPAATLPDLFARQAAARPRAVAVRAGEVSCTYGELALRAARWARHLERLGVRRGDRVGLLLAPGAELVAALLGILGAGATYVPLDPEWPEARAAGVLADAGCRFLVTAGAPPAGTGGVMAVTPNAAAGASPVPPPRRTGPEDAAYVIYTSGSTGAPKGVPVPHANVVRLLAACADFGFGPDDVWTLFHSAAFDFSVWELWGALAHGGRLVVVPRAVARAPGELLELLARERVTVLNQTPSAFAQLDREDAVRAGAGREADLAALRWIVFGGEALDPAALAGWFRRRGDRRPRLVNMYGITETTVHVTQRPLGAADAAAARSGGGGAAGRGGPIGVPLPHLTACVVDRRGGLVPEGVAGELWVGGGGVARGYLGRPALTAERFVPDPFAGPGAAGGRLYRSGDRVRWNGRGELEYLGRIDRQVQVRGFRVEPGEVEAALRALPAVAAAAVVAHRDRDGATALAAFLVAAPDAGAGAAADDLHVEALKAALRRRLPEAMVPARLEAIDALPLTVNGKVDRAALAARAAAADGRPDLRRPYEAPRSALEEVLAGAWAEALGVERVGRRDSFFDLGGHSLLATRLVSWVRDVLGVEVPLAALFAAPTVAGLAAAVEAAGGADAERGAELLLETAALSEEEVAAALPVAGGPVAGAGTDGG
jgi:amino acid adenylation domain-containing protein